jgi:alanine racemase
MDWTLVDVTDLADVRIGSPVTLLGRDGDAVITAEEWADKVGSITYEVFCNISRRVPRVLATARGEG